MSAGTDDCQSGLTMSVGPDDRRGGADAGQSTNDITTTPGVQPTGRVSADSTGVAD
ncbi:MAG: hypothetical protein MZV64_30810 [Ignavibacteriales bacterium]|nr:hypothetical protein [Ignavibacteriales bacterium]